MSAEGSELASLDGSKSGNGEVDVYANEAERIRSEIMEVKDQLKEGFWRLAELLWEVFDKNHYLKWGYDKWTDYAERELEMRPRKAQYLVSIWNYFAITHKESPELLAKVRPLEWTKVKELIQIVTPENVDEWVATAQRLTLIQLTEACREALQGDSSDGGTGQTGTDRAPPMSEQIQRMTFAVFPEQKKNIVTALKRAEEMADSDKKGHLLDLICTAFLAENADSKGVFDVLRRFEKMRGVKLSALDLDNGEVVFGKKTVSKVLKWKQDKDAAKGT